MTMSNEGRKEQSRNTFDRMAATYEKTPAGRQSRRMRAAVLTRLGCPIAGSLLDVGCGPGLLLQALAKQHPELTLAGIDLSPEMIRAARERLGARADLRIGDGESLPWEDDRFDYLTCVLSFHHYPRPELALAEMHRVLRPGGRLVIADPWAPPILRQLANATIIRFSRRGDVRIYGEGEMRRMLHLQGFEKAEWATSRPHEFIVTAIAV
jgi:ubiquinone/menaquinone biosynthesis C-methylase UbiE